MLRDGRSTDECEAFLVEIAVVHMGLGLDRDGAIRLGSEAAFRRSSQTTVAAVRAYAVELDADPRRP